MIYTKTPPRSNQCKKTSPTTYISSFLRGKISVLCVLLKKMVRNADSEGKNKLDEFTQAGVSKAHPAMEASLLF